MTITAPAITSAVKLATSTRWQSVLKLGGVNFGRGYQVRLRGESLQYRVKLDGFAGEEVLTIGTIGPGVATVRVAALPDVMAGSTLLVEVIAGADQVVRVEAAWVPILTVGGTHALGAGPDGARVVASAG